MTSAGRGWGGWEVSQGAEPSMPRGMESRAVTPELGWQWKGLTGCHGQVTQSSCEPGLASVPMGGLWMARPTGQLQDGLRGCATLVC